MRPHLLGIQCVTPDQEVLDCLGCPEASRLKRIIKNPIPAGHHMWSRCIVSRLYPAPDITIDVTQRNPLELLQRV